MIINSRIASVSLLLCLAASAVGVTLLADDRPLPATNSVIAATCTAGPTTLCLNNQRFKLDVRWRDFEGKTGVGQAVPLTSDTGYFWFFSSSNVELVVKVLDGRGLNGKFWVFFGALSNVEYTRCESFSANTSSTLSRADSGLLRRRLR